MDRELRDKWAEALRSGRYTQGLGALRTVAADGSGDDEFCCLGVLCDIKGPEFGTWHRQDLAAWSFKIASMDFAEEEFERYFDGDFGDHPDLLELTSEQHDFLVNHNDGIYDQIANPDSEQYDFEEMAGWIESNL